jgi:glutamate-5-semialdehyde dehydrogenase
VTTPDTTDLAQYCLETARRAKAAAAELMRISGGQKNNWLRQSARMLRERTDQLAAANQKDLDAAPGFGLTDAQIDRLRLTPERVDGIAAGLEQIAMLPDPVGEVIQSSVRPNGLAVNKVRVPLGVVFFIYESRPNVTADAAALCVKSGNAVILRGGKEAAHSSRAIVDVLVQAAADNGIPSDAVQMVATTDREAVGHFLKLHELIDVTIPRGGKGLIRRVASDATMPVIKHYEGNCHVYVDRVVDLDMAELIVVNSKCQRMGVCNSAESLLVHTETAGEFLPAVAATLGEQGIELRGDERTCELVPHAKPASEEDYATEYLGPILSVRVVESLDEAIAHINRYGSHHTDAIVTSELAAARDFCRRVDSCAVMVNASTRFNDGGEFGLGAEIGISTDKFHARGPCGLQELTSYKWEVYGEGQLKS